MSSATMAAIDLVAPNQHSRQRRRSRKPDWNTFYRNGLPKEIIVIEDSPEPEASDDGRVKNSAVTATNDIIKQRDSSRDSPASKKRRKVAVADRTSGYHKQFLPSHRGAPHLDATAPGSTFSNGCNNSPPNTFLPSLSSTSYRGDTPAPLKRKRTRQQMADGVRPGDIDGLGAPLVTYLPPSFPPKKAGDVKIRVVKDKHSHGKTAKFDDDKGYYIVKPDDNLIDRYKLRRFLGKGTFGKVVEAYDRNLKKLVAVKIVRSPRPHRETARNELRVLATLKDNDGTNKYRCIHCIDCFDYRGHICIVTPLLSQSVFDFLKDNDFVPFPNSHIQSFARQLLTSVAFLHDLHLIHTDLKPENIMLKSQKYQAFTYNRNIPSSTTKTSRHATQRRVLLDTEIQLIDFGWATFEDEPHAPMVSTSYYRAPEVILGLGWSYPCDIWSFGCILVELFTGNPLFKTEDNLELLAMMKRVAGKDIDSDLIKNANKMSGDNSVSKYFKGLKLAYPTPTTTTASRRFVRSMKPLDDIIPSNNTFLKNLLDLLKQIFVYNPAHRITAKAALNHPWFKEIVHPDDGTEAAKIRLEYELRTAESRRNPVYVS